MKDEIEYFREVQLLESVSVELSLAGLSDDGSRFRIRNTFKRSDDKPAAIVTSTGGWLDLSKRRLVPAPDALLEVMKRMERTADFEALPTSVRPASASAAG